MGLSYPSLKGWQVTVILVDLTLLAFAPAQGGLRGK